MGDPLGSSRVSSQKQNYEGVVEAQSRQYRVTAKSSPGCGGGPGRDDLFYGGLDMCKEGLLTLQLEDATTGQRFRAEGVEEDLGKLGKRL
ncbi:hypothetical protein DVH24_021156 [Malus domestica]|uniref:Uncharacterized protein n=1 Tax=Malus domestica TaxID=3750 RepID=A0A498JE87_MALDO|nr:hypothetical protein DVH24_021156 [Malus domestica]